MAEREPVRATIEVWRGHLATLHPVVPEVRDRLLRPVFEFAATGPNGHAMRPVVSDVFAEVITRPSYVPSESRVERTENQIVPQGMITEVVGWAGRVLKNWVGQLGPCHRWADRDAVIHWAVETAAAHGFEETPGEAELAGLWQAADDRWRDDRRHVRKTLAYLVTGPVVPPTPTSGVW